jgi:hypothetical protein
VLRLVAQALEGEGPDAAGVGPLLRAVAHLAETMGIHLETDVGAMVAARMEAGRATYGALDLGTDPRNFMQEALEELVDACAYLSMETVRRGAR